LSKRPGKKAVIASNSPPPELASEKAATAQPKAPVAHASFPSPADPIERAKEKALATLTLKSSVNAAIVVEKFSKKIIPGVSLGVLQEELSECLRKVSAGDMKQAETMLMGQAIALQSIFLYMAARVPGQEYVSSMQNFLGMALKAQNQCRMTLETLNELKNPRQVSFVRADQANVSHGHQQVNNQMAPRGENPENGPNELLEQTNGERLEQRTAPATESDDSPLAALEAIDGTENSNGQSDSRPQRVSRRPVSRTTAKAAPTSQTARRGKA
jgi:hypothetical protein